MKKKQIICLLEEDITVVESWRRILGRQVDLVAYTSIESMKLSWAKNPGFIGSCVCFILPRFLEDRTVDICEGYLVNELRAQGVRIIFLNWQGFISKKVLESKFDGRIGVRMGIEWSTLRRRIAKIQGRDFNTVRPLRGLEKHDSERIVGGVLRETRARAASEPRSYGRTRPQRCKDLLLSMAEKAAGRHRDRLKFLANRSSEEGTALLEAIYNRLLVHSEVRQECPSTYINSSPVVARSILKETLFG